jgi:mono/diheme cytochrome c family protein
MISPRMSRPLKVLVTVGAALAIGGLTSACGTQKIALSPGNPLYKGALLFSQRCSGCHTLSYAAANGSAQYVRTKEFNNGPNFNVRCERPVTRVLYAIENGGFSGQIMPQNIVVGADAQEVAKFVATYAGRQAPNVPGAVQCDKTSVGTLPSSTSTSTGSGASTGSSTTTTGGSTTAVGVPNTTSNTTSTTTPASSTGQTGSTHKSSKTGTHKKSQHKKSRRNAKRP